MIPVMLAAKVPILTTLATIAYLVLVLISGSEVPLTVGYLTVTIPLISYGLYDERKRHR